MSEVFPVVYLARDGSTAFLRDNNGRRPVYSGTAQFQEDPHWRDYVPFHEYFHGDNGAGVGASHQTGWSGTIAMLMHAFATVKPEQIGLGNRMDLFRTSI